MTNLHTSRLHRRFSQSATISIQLLTDYLPEIPDHLLRFESHAQQIANVLNVVNIGQKKQQQQHQKQRVLLFYHQNLPSTLSNSRIASKLQGCIRLSVRADRITSVQTENPIPDLLLYRVPKQKFFHINRGLLNRIDSNPLSPGTELKLLQLCSRVYVCVWEANQFWVAWYNCSELS